MENNTTLKDEIVAAVKVELSSLKVELTEKMDEGFRRQGVPLETMQGYIDTLVEGQEVLHGRIDRLQGTVSRIETKVEDIDARLTAVEMV